MLLRMGIWKCCSGLGLSQSLVPGMCGHVGMLLRRAICICYSGLGLSQSLEDFCVNTAENVNHFFFLKENYNST
jgi:hypothetical protein